MSINLGKKCWKKVNEIKPITKPNNKTTIVFICGDFFNNKLQTTITTIKVKK